MTSVYPFNACKPCNLSEDRKVNAYLGDADFQWDGSNGDVMLEMPIVYTARYLETDADGVEWEYRWIASAQTDNLHIHPAFTDGDQVYQKIYIPIFNGSASSDGTKLESKAGVYPLLKKTRAQLRTLSTAKGDGWCLDDVWNMNLLDTLFIVMFAESNAQKVLGAGATGMPFDGTKGKALKTASNVNYIVINADYAKSFRVGQTISIGTGAWSDSVVGGRKLTKMEASTEIENATNVYFDGAAAATITAGTHGLFSCVQQTGGTIGMKEANGRTEAEGFSNTQVRFLWIEDWYGNAWQFRDGVNIKDYQHYVCNKRASYADSKYNGDYEAIGYVCPDSDHQGFIKTMGVDNKHPEYAMPIETGGSDQTYVGDYYWCASGERLVLSGGNANIGADAGPFYRYCTHDFGLAYLTVAGRPQCRKPL